MMKVGRYGDCEDEKDTERLEDCGRNAIAKRSKTNCEDWSKSEREKVMNLNGGAHLNK